jgi:hypothetical protein
MDHKEPKPRRECKKTDKEKRKKNGKYSPKHVRIVQERVKESKPTNSKQTPM